MSFLSGISMVRIIEVSGLLGLFLLIFIESGLFFGFFFPGDSLLFTAGLLASHGFFNIFAVVGVCFIAAVAGVHVGYMFGEKIGPKLFTREDSLFFHKKHLVRAREFYAEHGARTIVLARFMPIIRTFAPILAGVGQMPYRTFLVYNIIGAALWAIGLPFAGYYLGRTIPDIDQYLLPIIAGIIIVSFIPSIRHLRRK